MPALEQVDRHEDGEQVHVGRVKLEVDIRWTEMVAGRHDSDHEEGEAHRVEEGEGGTGASVLDSTFRDLAPQLKDSRPATFSGWLHVHPLQFSSQEHILLHEGDQEEEETQEDVANITQDVVPHIGA